MLHVLCDGIAIIAEYRKIRTTIIFSGVLLTTIYYSCCFFCLNANHSADKNATDLTLDDAYGSYYGVRTKCQSLKLQQVMECHGNAGSVDEA